MKEIFRDWVLMFFRLQRVGGALAFDGAHAEVLPNFRATKVTLNRLPLAHGKVLSVDNS
jgi:hypothetical protein